MDKSHIKTEIFIGLAVAAIIGLAGWLAGYIDDSWRFLGRMAKTIGSFLTAGVSIPVWGLAIGVLAILLFGSWSRKKSHAPMVPSDPKSASESIDELKFRILRELARADGRAISLDQLSVELNVPRLRLVDSVAALAEMEYLEAETHYLNGPMLSLTGKGIKFVLEMKLVR